jgi:hypothetical protein
MKAAAATLLLLGTLEVHFAPPGVDGASFCEAVVTLVKDCGELFSAPKANAARSCGLTREHARKACRLVTRPKAAVP